jgi:predicted kinase
VTGQSTLYIFAGLPAVGKSTLARQLAKHVKAAYFRADTVEQGLRDLCNYKVTGEGYRLSYRMIADNLSLGISAIADSCNPWELTRNEWRQVATKSGARFVDIEIICSDKEEHRKRVVTRKTSIDGLTLPTWEEIEKREYHPWRSERIVIDTAGISECEAFGRLRAKLEKRSLLNATSLPVCAE